jgi:hypothetical protein
MTGNALSSVGVYNTPMLEYIKAMNAFEILAMLEWDIGGKRRVIRGKIHILIHPSRHRHGL